MMLMPTILSMEALGEEKHHFVAKDSLVNAGFTNTDEFPAIRMMHSRDTKLGVFR